MQAAPRSDDRPIGVFDSGLGGLSVLRQLRALLPHEDFVYIADQGRAPYGDLSGETIRSYTMDVVDHLLDHHGVKAVVIACNTASDAALDHVRAARPSARFIGMEPAVKPAAALSRTGRVGVLATTRTVEGARLARVIEQYATGITVMSQPCPGLVELVEDGLSTSPHAERLISEYVLPLIDEGADTLVLGCTHYSFLTDTIRSIAGPDITLVDPAGAVAEQTMRVVHESCMGNQNGRPGEIRYETSADAVRMRVQLKEILEEDSPTHGSPVWPRRVE